MSPAGASQQLTESLESVAPGATSLNVELARLSRWRIGGTAAALVKPRTTREAADVLAVVSELMVPVVIVGETSNLLFDSRGFDGVVIKIGDAMSDFSIDGTGVWAQAGLAVPMLARTVGLRGLTGIEHVVGIPGTLGGLVLMNGGSQRRGIGENIDRIICANASGELFELDQAACGFSYRRSSLQRQRVVVLEVWLRLEHGDRVSILDDMEKIVAERSAKFPSDYPNCGSTFLSDPGMYTTIGPPGRAIEEAGLKGYRVGDAQVSTRHANFLLNLGSASSDDMLQLIALIRRTVHERTGYLMDCEVRHVSPTGDIRPAHEVTTDGWGHALTHGA